jgi:hypothetical protein
MLRLKSFAIRHGCKPEVPAILVGVFNAENFQEMRTLTAWQRSFSLAICSSSNHCMAIFISSGLPSPPPCIPNSMAASRCRLNFVPLFSIATACFFAQLLSSIVRGLCTDVVSLAILSNFCVNLFGQSLGTSIKRAFHSFIGFGSSQLIVGTPACIVRYKRPNFEALCGMVLHSILR